MKNILRLTIAVLFIAISTNGQAVVLSGLSQETEEKLLIKKGRELANETGMKNLVQVYPPSRPDVIEVETISPGTLLFIEEKVKMEVDKSEYVALIVIVGKGKQAEDLQLRHYYKYTVQFERKNDQWQVVRARYTNPPKLI